MRFTVLLSIALVPIGAFGAPASIPDTAAIEARQARPAKPKPCVPLVPAPTEEETLARHYKFANAFIVTKNITEAFTYITQGYINHNPAAQNGFDSAWNILSPIWGSQNITPLRTAFKSPQGWLNYQSGSFGTIVDRFRWEGGCIAEHWDSGERFPTNVNSTACSRTTCGGI